MPDLIEPVPSDGVPIAADEDEWAPKHNGDDLAYISAWYEICSFERELAWRGALTEFQAECEIIKKMRSLLKLRNAR